MLARLLSRFLPTLSSPGGNAASAAATLISKPSQLDLAAVDFRSACPLLELHEALVAGADHALAADAGAQDALFERLRAKWASAAVSSAIPFANDAITLQLAELFQHIADLDAGDSAGGALSGGKVGGADSKEAADIAAAARGSAAFSPSVSPSSHGSGGKPSLALVMRARRAREGAAADADARHALAARAGFALWTGPSQAPTAVARAGVYIKGHVPAGTVVSLYPGAVYSAEMRLRAGDSGALRDPRVRRALIPRFDGSVIDVWASAAAEAAARNPYALAQHIRAAPRGITPNVMRLQYDFVAGAARAPSATSAVAAAATAAAADSVLPFPEHLRGYIPNVWGADVSAGQELYAMLEQNIWVKGAVIVALRPLWDEELFLGVHAANPADGLPLADALAQQAQPLPAHAPQSAQLA